MFDPIECGREFFERLTAVDAMITAKVAASACSRCGGPLHVGNYPRKPRGGLLATAGEDFVLRFSLCCGREGCRRRTTPPSVRFLGRRVYLGAVVILASAIVMAIVTGAAARRATGVPARTIATVGPLVARVVPGDDGVRESVGTARPGARAQAAAHVVAGAPAWLFRGEGSTCARVARAADDGEHAGWSALREGPRVTKAPPSSTQRMARALFSRAT